MTWHLEHVIASVPASSVDLQHAGLLLGAPAPLWGQPTAAQAGQGALWPLLYCFIQVGSSLYRCSCVQVHSSRHWHPINLQANTVPQALTA